MYHSTISLVETVTKKLKKFDRQCKHSWNYTSHPTIIRHPSKEWTIAILLKLLLIAWDMWMYRIGFKSKTSQHCGKVYWNRRRKKYVRVFTLPRRNTVQHHGKSSFADHTDRNENDILSACHVFVGSTVWTVKEDFKEIQAYTLKSQSQIRDQPQFDNVNWLVQPVITRGWIFK